MSSARTRRTCALAALVLAACGSEPLAPPVPEVLVRRLTAFEYQHTVGDVLGVAAPLAREFPSDPPALGFDTIAAVQSTSALLVQIYQFSAESVADATRRSPDARAALIDAISINNNQCDPDPAPCAREIIKKFITRAWRRPPTEPELDRYLGLLRGAPDFDSGLRLVLEAALLSPHFTFRWERDLGPPGSSHWLDDYALAARLSYFLWSSAPDDALLSLAAAGALSTDPDALERETARMLADPRAANFINSFAGQWLYFRGLDDIFRDAHRYPEYNYQLRDSMHEALRRRFAEFLKVGRDLRDLLRDPNAHVDAHLAPLYRIDAPEQFARLDLTLYKRRGLLTEPGLLTVLAYPFNTSPTRRGRFVLEQLLCEPLPPPPPDAAAQPPSEAATARERLAQHRADPACAGCHAVLDPIGLAFENYDAIGAWRGSERGELIDAAGQLATGESFSDVRELAEVLADDPRFGRCVATKLLTYALGRELVVADADTLDQIHEQFVASDHDLVALIVAIVQSDPFRARRSQDGI